MTDNVHKINDEQLRTLANLEAAYDTWMQAQRDLPILKPWLAWRKVGGREYLYEVRNRAGYGQSLGARSQETESRYEAYLGRQQVRNEALARSKSLTEAVQQIARVYRALRLPVIDQTAGAVLRAADRIRLLGQALLVVGTNTMAAYEIEARHRFATGLDSTADFDLTWVAGSGAYAIAGKPADPLRPKSMREQEWLLLGERVSHVVIDRGGLPARIVAPDPRWMALHKQWLADKPGRNPLKVDKDRAQGRALLAAVRAHMPQFPIDEAFMRSVPDELRRYL